MSNHRIISIAAVLLLSSCATSQEAVQRRVAEMEPLAMQAARERGQTDLGCGGVQAKVAEREVGDLARVQGLHRVVYRVDVAGCGRKSRYAVACTPNSVCSAMSDSGVVERQ
ncbi:MAG TPA: hypothetical protein VFA81_07820 [Burkholderiales bacterium]|nr:hypothetical protein [Burkholderiales bacterium]